MPRKTKVSASPKRAGNRSLGAALVVDGQQLDAFHLLEQDSGQIGDVPAPADA